MSRTILVTGANGQLGREMRRVGERSQDRYIYTDVEELDITDRDSTLQLLKAETIDVIVNCAGYTNVERAEDERERAEELNSVAVGYLAEASLEVGATLIHISTDYIFDGESNTPYTEMCEAHPLGVYGESKLAGERAVEASGCSYIIIRTSWMYSRWGDNFVTKMMRLLRERDSLDVVADQIGSPTSAGDLAEAIGYIIETSQYANRRDIYHYSNEGECTWYDFARQIASIGGYRCEIRPIRSCDYPTRVRRPHYSVLDTGRVKSYFGVSIHYWVESLKRVMAELKY